MFSEHGAEAEHNHDIDMNLLKCALDYHLHQNRLMWSRAQFVFLIQAAIIGGSYSVSSDPLAAFCLTILGIITSYIVLYIFSRDEQLRDINNELIVPDGCIDILFRVDKITKEFQVLVIGMMDAPSEVYLEYDRIQTFGIRFYPGVLYPFFKHPLND